MPSTVTHHALPQPLSNGHTEDTERERRRKILHFSKENGKKRTQGKFTWGEQPYRSFSLLKSRGEKRRRWGPPLPRDLDALQHRRDVA